MLLQLSELAQKTAHTGGALFSVFHIATQGISMKAALISALELHEKVDAFEEMVKNEGSEASIIFAANCVYETLDHIKVESAGWDMFFNVVDKALARTAEEVTQLADDAEMQSLGRIEYGAKLLRQWHGNQDSRLHPVFDAFGKISSIETELASFFPPGDYDFNYNGKRFSLHY